MAARSVTVIGAGASGLAAAISAAQAGAHVTVLEAGTKIGRSILASGNGRCNFANADLAPVHYNNPVFAGRVMGDQPLSDILSFFDGLGLWSRADSEGRLFPRSRMAASVLDVLLAKLDDLGVTIRDDTRVVEVGPARQGGRASWRVSPDKGRAIETDAVVWAAGGGSAEIPCDCLGIALVPERAALCPLATKRGAVKGLDGVRVQCEASLVDNGSIVARESGEVLFRPYGVSGIVIFNLSRIAKAGDTLTLNFMPGLSLDGLVAKLGDRLAAQESRCRTPEGRRHFLDGVLHPLLGKRCMELVCGNKCESQVDLESLARTMLEFTLKVKGTADESHGQVTQGGMDVDAFDARTLECASSPGFFACGEALDIDGECGGYNLSWAWCSGIRAGAAAASCGDPDTVDSPPPSPQPQAPSQP